MDSYRPGQSRDGNDNNNTRGRNEASRDSPHDGNPYDDTYDTQCRRSEAQYHSSRATDYDRFDGRARDFYDDYRRGPRDDYQSYTPAHGYRDEDRDYRGVRRFETVQDLDYDDRRDDRDARNIFNDGRGPRPGISNKSDELRYRMQQEGPPSTGEKDQTTKGETSRYLLILNLKPTVNEELLAKGLEKLYRSADEHKLGATPLSVRSVMIVKRRDDNVSMGYGFAEFHDPKDAMAARDHSSTSEKEGNLTVSSQRFSVRFPHGGVFIPAEIPGKHVRSTEPTEERFTFVNHNEQQVKYYDERYYVTSQIINAENPRDDIADTAAGVPATGTKRGHNAPETQQSKPKKVKKTQDHVPALPLFQGWQTKTAELRKDAHTASEPQMSDEQTYAVDDAEGQRCYLCGTKFSGSQQLRDHLVKSENHAAFAQDAGKIAKALERLGKKGVTLTDTVKLPKPEAPAVEPPVEQYNDRAAKRREGEPAKPAKVKMSLKSAIPRTPPGSSGSDGSKPAKGKGRGMMEKLGWSEGMGLGGEGEGRTAPVEQMAFAPGVGLGHEGAVRGDAVEEASRRTRDERGGFAEMVREGARKRFEGMR